jgi:hypothetical protein
MAKVTIHLRAKKDWALNAFALWEYRSRPAQVALIIQRQLLDLHWLSEKKGDLNPARGQLANVPSNFTLA